MRRRDFLKWVVAGPFVAKTMASELLSEKPGQAEKSGNRLLTPDEISLAERKFGEPNPGDIITIGGVDGEFLVTGVY